MNYQLTMNPALQTSCYLCYYCHVWTPYLGQQSGGRCFLGGALPIRDARALFGLGLRDASRLLLLQLPRLRIV